MIPERDIRIIQRQAFELYSNGKGQTDVKNMIREAGGNDKEVEELASKFANDLKFYHQEQNRIAKKNAPLDKIVGGILLFGGILISVGSYVFLERVFVIFWGAILVGGIMFVRALIAENKNSSN